MRTHVDLRGLTAAPLLDLGDLGFETPANVSTEKAIRRFLEVSEAAALRWIQFPAAVLLFVAVPGDPSSGGIYVFERRKGTFWFLEITEASNGNLTQGECDRLVAERHLVGLAQKPFLLRKRCQRAKCSSREKPHV